MAQSQCHRWRDLRDRTYRNGIDGLEVRRARRCGGREQDESFGRCGIGTALEATRRSDHPGPQGPIEAVLIDLNSRGIDAGRSPAWTTVSSIVASAGVACASTS